MNRKEFVDNKIENNIKIRDNKIDDELRIGFDSEKKENLIKIIDEIFDSTFIIWLLPYFSVVSASSTESGCVATSLIEVTSPARF